MEKHNTHILSEESNEEHKYNLDKKGNVVADSLDDRIYSQFIQVMNKNRKTSKIKEAINIIKNINYNIDIQLLGSIPLSEIMELQKEKNKLNNKKTKKRFPINNKFFSFWTDLLFINYYKNKLFYFIDIFI